MDSLENNMNNESNIFSKYIIKISKDKTYYGRLNDPTCAAYVKGACGDEMEYYLVIEDEKIVDVRFWTTGCVSSQACGILLAKKIINKDIYEALDISPAFLLKDLKDLPKEYHHCSILACLTLYKAIGEYFITE